MKRIEKKINYSDEELKILKSSIETVKKLNWNNSNKKEKRKNEKKVA